MLSIEALWQLTKILRQGKWPPAIPLTEGFLLEGTPIAGCSIMESPNRKWMITRGTLWWTNILPWKITIFNGKIHYSMAIFNSFLYVHQRVAPFLGTLRAWFSQLFPLSWVHGQGCVLRYLPRLLASHLGTTALFEGPRCPDSLGPVPTWKLVQPHGKTIGFIWKMVNIPNEIAI